VSDTGPLGFLFERRQVLWLSKVIKQTQNGMAVYSRLFKIFFHYN